MRVFIAIEFSDEIKTYLKHVQQVIKLGCTKEKSTRHDNFHITLKYIGQVSDSQIDDLTDLVDEVADKVNPFTIKLGDIGTFKSRNKNIVWQGITSGKKQLQSLYDLIENQVENYGLEKEDRRFKPHITLIKEAVFNESCVLESVPLFTEDILVEKISLMLSARENDILKYTPIYQRQLHKKRK